jgi:hypothetical protein
VQFEKEASQTRDYCVAKNATHRAARPDPSLRKNRLLGMTIKQHHYLVTFGFEVGRRRPCGALAMGLAGGDARAHL